MLKRGLITLNLLIILSSLLLFSFFMTDELLTNYSTIMAQRQNYLKEDIFLQLKSYQEKKARCENLPLDLVEDEKIIAFSQQQFTRLTHFVGCKRQRLFKRLPVRNQVTVVNRFISDDITYFQTMFPILPAVFNEQKEIKLYWIPATQNEIQLNGNINAVFIAQGDLKISGQGKINGAVITNGRLQLAKNVKLSYAKDVLIQLNRRYSRWQLAEKSWHDFNPIPL